MARVKVPTIILASASPRRAELLRQGISAGSETALRVYLDTSRTRAIGYRLYLFYPL